MLLTTLAPHHSKLVGTMISRQASRVAVAARRMTTNASSRPATARLARAAVVSVACGMFLCTPTFVAAGVSRRGARGARPFSTTTTPAAASHSTSTGVVSVDGGHANVQTVVFEPEAGKHTATMILTHGLGDTAEGWAPAVAYHYAPALPHMKFVLPTAPSQPVTLNMGMYMPSWYDIVGLSDRDHENCDGIDDSREVLLRLIEEEEARGIPRSRIILAGFSQGGALSLYTGLQLEDPVGAVIVKSGYLPSPSVVEENINKDAVRDLPMLFCHGDADPMVLPKWSALSVERVREWGATNVERKTYPGMEHAACIEELEDVIEFVKKVMP